VDAVEKQWKIHREHPDFSARGYLDACAVAASDDADSRGTLAGDVTR